MSPKRPIDGEFTAEVAAFGRSLKARNRSPKTIRSYVDSVNLLGDFLADEERSTAPVDISRADVEAFITDQLARWTPSTAATRYRCVQQFFKFLVEVEVIDASPMARMSPPSIPEDPVPVLSEDELRRLLKACQGNTCLLYTSPSPRDS